jgi:cytochrome c oxidase subunit 4
MPAEPEFSVRTYAAVLIALIVLTVTTVGASFVPWLAEWHMECGLGIAVIKASLVVLVFMHAMHSARLNWVVIAFALLWLFILVSLTVADYATRGLIPQMPGH